MEGWLIALIIVGAVIVLLLLYVMGVYNKLVTLKNRVKNQWSQIEVLLKRRADLIPNVVETVKGYIWDYTFTMPIDEATLEFKVERGI